jgi:hypothetical protein
MEDQADILTRLLPPHLRVVQVCALVSFLTATCLLPAPASAHSSSAEVSSEATNCFAFYALQRRCSPLDATPDSLDLVKSWAEKASDIAGLIEVKAPLPGGAMSTLPEGCLRSKELCDEKVSGSHCEHRRSLPGDACPLISVSGWCQYLRRTPAMATPTHVTAMTTPTHATAMATIHDTAAALNPRGYFDYPRRRAWRGWY